MEFELAMLEVGIEGPFETIDSLMPVFEHLMSQEVVFIVHTNLEPTNSAFTLMLSRAPGLHLKRDTDTLVEGVKSEANPVYWTV